MIRTFPANIDGQIFYIDEDAYLMLQDYLNELKRTFRGAEGEEIVTDIESRIRELFDQRISAGAKVIVKSDVAAIIETMGRPEQLGEDAGAPADTEEPGEKEQKPFIEINLPHKNNRRLYRNMKNRVFGGVLGGVATYLGWNANILRVLYAVISVCHFIIPMFPLMLVLYLIAWMVIPPAKTPRQILEMQGEPVTVDTVGRTFMATSTAVAPDGAEEGSAGFFTGILRVMGKVVMGFLGFFGTIMTITGLIAFITLSICYLMFMAGWSLNVEPFSHWHYGYGIPLAMVLVWCVAAIIAGIALIWSALCAIFNARPASTTTKIVALVMEILFISLGVALSIATASM